MNTHNNLYPDLYLIKPWIQKQLFHNPQTIQHIKINPNNKKHLYYKNIKLQIKYTLTYILLSIPKITNNQNEHVASWTMK
jgi:hypothetical protein